MSKRGMSLAGVLIAGSLLVFSNQTYAVLGFGIQGGKDQLSIDEASASFGLKDLTLASYSRAAVENPYMVGGFLYIDAIPFIDLEVAGEIAYQTYQVDYNAIGGTSYSEEVAWGRASIYVTARKDIIKLPPVVPVLALYVGGGIGFHYLAPMINQDFLYDNLESADTDLDPEEIITREFKQGFHGLAGVRLKPPIFPLGIRVEGRYTSSGGGDYEQPDSYMSIYGGVFLGF